ncbi:MAG: 16S rRNA (guanine(527)-N(7))-methyltransferase RsmG [Desulfobacterota bacterium]|jgi:16S rRNA (guanine527-N7)-methyltransferase|nr:16S rRNA (guanine(527)-N(7))-methyltransferase RsmG [Thermodesulfobacteriota bacterium]
MPFKPTNNSEQRFDVEEARTLLERGTRALGLELTAVQVEQFLTYLDLLLKWNRRINLTALRTPAEIISRHFLESLLLLPHLPETGRLLDIGSGAGVPGLPLKIARPTLSLDLAEATAKKTSFLKEALRRLGLSGVHVFAVFLGKEPFPVEPNDPWDAFLCRGVNLAGVLRAVAPYWGTGRRLLLLKGPDWPDEALGLATFLEQQQVKVEQVIPLINPSSEKKMDLVILRKTGPAP